ncbi:hypothetical protein NSQ26_09490 [Bacillus sp. FSL W7-1360]
MDIHVNEPLAARKPGDMIYTKDNHMYIIIEDKGESYPFLLVCLQTFTVIQNYDSLPTWKELEEDIAEEIEAIYKQEDARLSVS